MSKKFNDTICFQDSSLWKMNPQVRLLSTRYYITNFEKAENRESLLQAMQAKTCGIWYEKTQNQLDAIKRRGFPVVLTEETDFPIAVSKADIRSQLMAAEQLLPKLYEDYLNHLAEGNHIDIPSEFRFGGHFTNYSYSELREGRELLGLPFDVYV